MSTCPLCEHAQAAGEECEVCGHKLTGPGTEMEPVAPLAGLEPTRMEAVDVAAETFPDLEPTRLEAVVVPSEDPGWADPMRAEPAHEGIPDPVPGLEHHRVEPVPDEGPALDPLAPVVCRYSRSAAMPGDKFCGRCGMRLARFDPVRMAGSERAEPAHEGIPDPVPGLEHHRVEPVPDEGPALDPLAPVVCRYCRCTAMPGDKFCGRCGMRLARFDPVRMAGSERGELVCRDCGSMGAGPRCRRCGARMVEPT